MDAYAGRVDTARAAADEALELFERAGCPGFGVRPLAALGFLELSIGDHAAAAARVVPFASRAAAHGMPEPTAGAALLTGDAAEALIALSRLDEAEAIVGWLEERGAALDRAWAIAVGARCRALLLAARGDLDAAEVALERALVAHERLPMPVERGRTLLALGRLQRRRRRRLAARAALQEAAAIFERAGAPRWAEQAAGELACLGLDRGAPDRLTASEQRVASLAASGLTNQAVAGILFVSPKTVEAQLANAYRKLGIHTRAELGARMARGARYRETPDAPAARPPYARAGFRPAVKGEGLVRALRRIVFVLLCLAALFAPAASAHHRPVTELATFAAPGCEGTCGSGSTIGPDGALYVTDGQGGRVLRIDPRSGAITTFASGFPLMNTPPGIGGAIDVAFVGRTAYVLVANVGGVLRGAR